MSKPVSIAARNVKPGDTLQVDLGVRQWGRVTEVTPNGGTVRIATDNHLIGTQELPGGSRVTVKRAPVAKVGS